jgi:hypothetical protein
MSIGRQTPRTLLHSAALSVGAATIAAGIFAILPTSAQAATKISGNAQAVSIQAQGSSIEEVLAALGQQFNLHYRSSADLKNRITGTYQGSLRSVVARLLEGHDFVMSSGPEGLVITVFGGGKAAATTNVTIAAKSATPELVQNVAPAKTAAAPAPTPEQTQPATAKSDAHLPAPEVKVAEGPMPVPTPNPGAKSLPAPAPPSKTTDLAAPTLPAKDAPAVPAPEVKASNAAPPVPPGLLAPKPKEAPQADTTPKPEVTPPAGATPKHSDDKQ